MIRGTTPTLEFTLPFETGLIKEAFITFSQKDEVILDKPFVDCAAEGCKLIIRLSQEETLLFNECVLTEIQIRVRTVTGDALASNIVMVSTERILKDGVI